MFAGGRRDEVGGGVAEQAEFLEPQFRVLLLVVRGLLEDRGDLLIPFLAGDGGKVGVFVAGLRFSGERISEVGCSLAVLEVCHFQFSCDFGCLPFDTASRVDIV